MSDDNRTIMDVLALQDLRTDQLFDQARSGVSGTARLLKLHQEEMVKAGFTEEQAWQLTLQMHHVYATTIMIGP